MTGKTKQPEVNIFEVFEGDGKEETPQPKTESSPIKGKPISQAPVRGDEMNENIQKLQHQITDQNKRWFGFGIPKKR